MSAYRTIVHHRMRLALHELRGPGSGETAGPTLLLLHALGQRTPDRLPGWAAPWPGPVYGLDFTGHGWSSRPAGGGYTCEWLMADVDGALAELGPATVHGRGLGAYIGLLIAGGRPDLVRGVLLHDGPGLVGGGAFPGTAWIAEPVVAPPAPIPDPMALAELARDTRPPAYAVSFATQALAGTDLETPLVVTAGFLPPWLEAVADLPGVARLPADEGLALLAAAVS